MQKYSRIIDIKDMKSSTKEKIYKKLLNGFKYKLITEDKGYVFDIYCEDNDLKLSSWTSNFWCRTNKAIKRERYKSFDIAMYQLRKLGKKYDVNINSVVFTKVGKDLLDKGIVKIYL